MRQREDSSLQEKEAIREAEAVLEFPSAPVLKESGLMDRHRSLRHMMAGNGAENRPK